MPIPRFFPIAAFFVAATAPAAPLKIVCIGDSITQADGRRGGNGGYSYRYWLWKLMIEAGYSVDFVGSHSDNRYQNSTPPPVNGIPFDRDHEGHWGWQTQEIINGSNRGDATGEPFDSGDGKLSTWLTGYTPDVAFIDIGTNDLLRSENPNTTKNEVRQIVDALRADNPNVQIIIGRPPPPTTGTQASRFAQFGGLLIQAGKDWDLPNSTVYTKNIAGSGWNNSHVYDSLHPNAAGERIVAGNFYAVFESVFEPDTPTSLFDGWIADNSVPEGMRGLTDDPDLDSHSNLEEYALGMNPTMPDSLPGGIPSISNGADVAISFPMRIDGTQRGLSYLIEATAPDPTLPLTWTTASALEESSTPVDDAFVMSTSRFTREGSSRYFRLRILFSDTP